MIDSNNVKCKCKDNKFCSSSSNSSSSSSIHNKFNKYLVYFGSTNNIFFSFLPIFSLCSNVYERIYIMCRETSTFECFLRNGQNV